MIRYVRILLRLFTIARVLARHDALAALNAQEVVRGFGAARLPIALARLVSRRNAEGRPGQKLARAFGELGPAFTKLGQFLSTRADLFGESIARDLAELRDDLPPFSSAEARRIVESELDARLEDLFADFDDKPVSAASIAQVHFARVKSGRGAMAGTAEARGHFQPSGDPLADKVAVKVLRPGIEQAFGRDLELLHWLAGLIERTQPRLRRFRPREAVQTFEETVRMEMDLRMEAAAAAELAENFAEDDSYLVPRIDWQRSSRRVLTMERVAGIPMDDREALIAAGHDLEDVLDKAAAIFFNQVFRDGFFHGDQHPGNMFVTREGAILAVDFGIMGRLDARTRGFLADMLLALLGRDYRRLAQVFLAAGFLPPNQSAENFAQALRAITEPIHDRPLQEISFARILAQLLQLAESFEIPVQPQLLLLQKNMMMAEGVSRQLMPELNIWLLAEPLIADWLRRNRGPQARLREGAEDMQAVLKDIPPIITALRRAVEADAARAGEKQRSSMEKGLAPAAFGLSLAALLLAVLALWSAS